MSNMPKGMVCTRKYGQPKYVPYIVVYGWVYGWMGVKAVLRIAYSNHNYAFLKLEFVDQFF